MGCALLREAADRSASRRAWAFSSSSIGPDCVQALHLPRGRGDLDAKPFARFAEGQQVVVVFIDLVAACVVDGSVRGFHVAPLNV